MPEDLDERVAKLEQFRYRVIGRFNACQAMLFDVWLNYLEKHTDDPVIAAERMRDAWLKRAQLPDRQFPGVDPAHLDLVGQEHYQALDELSAELVRLAHQAKASAKTR